MVQLKRCARGLFAGSLLLALGASAASAQVVYNNGTPGQPDWLINSLRNISDDFTFSSATTIDAVRFFAGSFVGTPTAFSGTMDWFISDDNAGTPGAILASGSASPSVVFFSTDGQFYTNQYDFSIPNLTLGAGTYRLGVRDPGSSGQFYWDDTQGVVGNPAYDSQSPQVLTTDVAFELLGAPVSATPEPGSLVLLGTGLFTLGVVVVRRRRA